MHLFHLKHTLDRSATLFPLKAEYIQKLTADEIGFLDQLVFRFSRLQDSMGHKLFNSGLASLGEVVDELTMIDKLNHLEKYSVLDETDKWLELRELRNQLIHDYPDEDEHNALALNLLHDESQYLKKVFETFVEFIDAKLRP